MAHAILLSPSLMQRYGYFSTGMALIFILNGKIQEHRQWMARSFASAILFLEVRTIIGITGWGQHGEIIVGCCVAAAIPLADFALQWQDFHQTRAITNRSSRIALTRCQK